MEIPIQVACRIFCGAKESPVRTLQKDNNGNVSLDVAEEVNPDALQRKDVNEDDGNVDGFVQAVSYNQNTSGYLNKLQNGNFDSCITGGLIQIGQHTFPVTHALSAEMNQSQVYHQTVYPLISLFLEGFDASIVTYGQCGTGKTYTLYGPGVDFIYSEVEQGIVQRCVKEIFAHMASHSERTYAINIGWVEICNNEIHDLLGVGNVSCSKISDVFHWIQVGMASKERLAVESDTSATYSHTLFTLTLEQQWISKDALIQHRLSTASFSDLCSTDRILLMNPLDQTAKSVPKDISLLALEQIVQVLTDPALLYSLNGNVPYNDTALTTLLKDSFGGRAQTLFILCVSPFESDAGETVANLQFAFKVQCVRNFVIMNTYSDDNTPAVVPNTISTENNNKDHILRNANDNFGLQFTANQWFKLVTNAEILFSKLASNNTISDLDKEQIEEWLFLKQECEDCLSSNEALPSQKQLVPIQEADEPDETVSEPDTSCQQNSDNSDSESQRPDLDDKLELLMDDLRIKTDTMVKGKYDEFIKTQPQAVMKSQENLLHNNNNNNQEISGIENIASSANEERKISLGRRRSIQPGASLSSAEIAMLNRVASREQAAASTAVTIKTPPDDFPSDPCDLIPASPKSLQHIRSNIPIENIQRKLRKLDTDIEARQLQIKEIEQTMQLKQNIIADLIKNSETRSHAKQRFHKKKAKLEAEVEKVKKQVAKAMIQGKDKADIERLQGSLEHLQERLQDLISIKHIAGESAQKVKKLQQSLYDSKKSLDDLQKKVKKEKKLRDQLEIELKNLKEKENVKALARNEGSDGAINDRQLEEMQARISHLDHVLREKSENLVVCETEGKEMKAEKESLRHEIRNLRRTRDHLLDQRCSLDRKLKKEKSLSQREERKLLECDEAIEAIDAAIEFKNELICGHKSIDTSERLQREKGEQMLMARLNKLSTEEMRTLLYKYFTKVIDLRDASRKLEVQLMQLERERDVWEWKERVLSNAVRQARLEGERNAVLLQRQHEMKLTLMLRHLAEETSVSSSSYSDHHHHHHQPHSIYQTGLQAAQHLQQFRPNYVANLPAHLQAAVGLPSTTSMTTTSGTSDSDFDLEFYRNSLQSANTAACAAAVLAAPTQKMLKAPKHSEMEIRPSLPDALTKYKPLDKLKEKERDTKNKLFAKFQVLTRYTGQSSLQQGATANATAANLIDEENSTSGRGVTLADGLIATMTNKRKEKTQRGDTTVAAIPPENLRKLASSSPVTKVTRQKNKIIIQNASRKN